MADYNFKLVIGDNTFQGGNTIEGEDLINVYRLHGVRFNRKIYQPGEIEAEISLPDKKTVSELPNLLLMKKVKLSLGETTIAENYYVHEILPQQKKGDVGIFVKLMIYSMDKLMTLDKYSKVYAGMKLGAEILNKERQNFKLGDTTLKVDFEGMRMLKYMYSRFINNKIESGKQLSVEIPSEFIQPYLVQYNESFYDFLSRTANRCGEFLYFENGKLMLGLNTRTEPILIQEPDSITYKNISTSKLDIERYARDTMKDKWGVMEETNYDVVKKNMAGYPNDAFPGHTAYNSELASDEFFFPLYADKFTTFKREMDGASLLFPILYDITANSADVVDFAFKVAEDIVKNHIEAAETNARKNEKGNKSYFSIGDKDNDEKIDLVLNNAKMMEKGDGKTCIVPFGSLSKDGWTTLDYYRDVRKYEEQLQRDIICIDMGTNYVDVKLGDKIKLSETGNPYTVIQILMVNDNAWTHTYTDYDGHTSPMTQANPNQKIFAIPYLKSEKDGQEVYKPYPPVLDAPVIRKAEPQTAFVTDSNDPKLQGRVRIVYPWQTDSTGDMKRLAVAEAEYEEAQKDYLEKKKNQENLEKELEVLKKEKQVLEDEKKAKEEAKEEDEEEDKVKKERLQEINGKITAVNTVLGKNSDDDTKLVNNDITDDLVTKEFSACTTECATLEEDVNKLEEELDGQYAKLRKLESEKAQLQSELADLEAQKKQLEIEKAELEGQKENETDNGKIKALGDQIKDKETAIDDLNDKISGNENNNITGIKTKIENKEKEIENQIGNKDKANTIEKTLADIDKKRKELDARRERYRLVLEKKKIQDYYEELSKNSKEGIEKKIAVLKSYVKDARDATTDAKDKLGKKEEVVNNLEKKVQAAVAKMASPWIRMTSPMATNGGGTIFKPRKGDEVLVNYECGNVERPYVVGSLFSKNVLEPDERINRQVGPNLHKKASIAIVSPNGHGITFKDPGDDSGFIASVYPGIGVITKYNPDAEWPKSKDLAGGIRIGDRYGLYSIDMSSDKRSVKISSSLGTVSLNAFTGITISAPNGDIKIEGKNVSIKAGNNLTLTSGTNIETTSKRKKKHNSTGELVGTLMGMGVTRVLKEFLTPFIDISLARTAFEVVLGPIEGTTLIKSHRYMKLEAGPGKAMIQQDRYTNKVSVSSKLSALVPSLNNYNCDKLAEDRELYSYIVYIIRTFNENISKFCDTYKTNWRYAYDKKIAYGTHTVCLAGDANNPDILANCIFLDTWNDLEETDFAFDPAHNDQKDRTDLLASANELGEAGVKFLKHLNDFITMPELEANPLPVEQAVWQVGKDILEEIIHSCHDDFESKYVTNGTFNNNFLSSDTPDDFSKNLTEMKRRFSALLLIRLAADNNYKDILKIRYKESDLNDNIISSKDEWHKFVSAIKLEPDPGFVTSFVNNVKDPLVKAIDLDGWLHTFKEKDMWNDKKNGQILLSDSKDFTIDFEGGGLNKCEKANQANTDFLKELLNTI